MKIRCDSKVEYCCLDYFEKQYKVKSIRRADIIIKFFHDGIEKSYLPDFIIETECGTYLVECKAEIGKNANVSRKWGYYYDTIEEKKKALEKYCEMNNMKSFFFTKSLHSSFYYSINTASIPSA